MRTQQQPNSQRRRNKNNYPLSDSLIPFHLRPGYLEIPKPVALSRLMGLRSFYHLNFVTCVGAGIRQLEVVDADLHYLWTCETFVNQTILMRIKDVKPKVSLAQFHNTYTKSFGEVTRLLRTKKGNHLFYSIEFRQPRACQDAMKFLEESKQKDVISFWMKTNALRSFESHTHWDMRNLYVRGVPTHIGKKELETAVIKKWAELHNNIQLQFITCVVRPPKEEKNQEITVAMMRCNRFSHAASLVAATTGTRTIDISFNGKSYALEFEFAHPGRVEVLVRGRTHLIVTKKLLRPKECISSTMAKFIKLPRYRPVLKRASGITLVASPPSFPLFAELDFNTRQNLRQQQRLPSVPLPLMTTPSRPLFSSLPCLQTPSMPTMQTPPMLNPLSAPFSTSLLISNQTLKPFVLTTTPLKQKKKSLTPPSTPKKQEQQQRHTFTSSSAKINLILLFNKSVQASSS